MSGLFIIVPARGGSRRLPGKNVRQLAGVSLLGWTLGAVRAAGFSETPVLSTEDETIAAEGRRLGYAVPFLRPAALAADDTPTVPVVLHALDRHAASGAAAPDFVMLLQPTSPFRAPRLLSDGLDAIGASPEAETLIAVRPLHVGLQHVYRAEGPTLAPATTASGTGYVPSGALYIARTESLRCHESFVAPRCLWIAHDGLSALDIDTEDDWAVAEAAVAAGRVAAPGA
jgi:CMP-N,N'-diacetyllegionaminic acid synthase